MASNEVSRLLVRFPVATKARLDERAKDDGVSLNSLIIMAVERYLSSDTKPDTIPDTNPDTKPDTIPDTNPDTKPDTIPDITQIEEMMAGKIAELEERMMVAIKK